MADSADVWQGFSTRRTTVPIQNLDPHQVAAPIELLQTVTCSPDPFSNNPLPLQSLSGIPEMSNPRTPQPPGALGPER